MSAEHIHLMLNHAPLFAVVFAIPVLAYGLLRRNATASRIALWGFVAAALFTLPVYVSGENSEEAVEDLPGVSEAIMEQHEEAAGVTMMVIGILGIASAAALVISRKQEQLPRSIQVGVIALSAGAMISAAYTNNLGGQIRHSEIRTQATVNPATTGTKEAQEEAQEEAEHESSENNGSPRITTQATSEQRKTLLEQSAQQQSAPTAPSTDREHDESADNREHRSSTTVDDKERRGEHNNRDEESDEHR